MSRKIESDFQLPQALRSRIYFKGSCDLQRGLGSDEFPILTGWEDRTAMGKAPAGAKKTPKSVAVIAPPARLRRRLFRPGTLCLLASIVAAFVLYPVYRRWLPELDARPEYRISEARIALTPPPRWIPTDIIRQVFEQAGLTEPLSLQDPTLCERIAAAFHTHPWIDKVISVRKSWPARIHVDVSYRTPVAMVRGTDGFYPIDSHGTLLPGRDFAAADVDRYPIIDNVASVPVGRLGEAWGDPAVAEAAFLAAVLLQQEDSQQPWWERLQLAGIEVPSSVSPGDSIENMQFVLCTRGGSRILWGRGPGCQHPGELEVARKLERLAEFQKRYGRIDDEHGPWLIDIRQWDGIRKGLLSAAAPGSTPAR